MSRNHRQDPADGWHHVTNHAVGSEDLFLDDTDRHEFIRRMNEAAAKYDITVVAFCLMGNHFHLVLSCPTAGVSRFMHYLESVYAREFNMRHARRGALVASGFYNKLIGDDGQAMATVRYVHRNPLELGLDIRSYPWSSYLACIGEPTETFVADSAICEALLGGHAVHKRYVETDFDHDELKMSMGTRLVVPSPPLRTEHSIIELAELASQACSVPIVEILAPRSTAKNDARLAVSLVAYESQTGLTEDLRRLLGYRSSNSMISAVRRARKRLDADAQFRSLVFDLRSAWEPVARRDAA